MAPPIFSAHFRKINFTGYHDKIPSKLNHIEKEYAYNGIAYESPDDLCPEYYIINLIKFKQEVKNRLAEWIYFFKTTTIKPTFKAKGLEQVKKKLSMNRLNAEERREYASFLKNEGHKKSDILSAIDKGEARGRVKGKAEGEAAEKRAVVMRMHKAGIDTSLIGIGVDLTVKEVERILAEEAKKPS